MYVMVYLLEDKLDRKIQNLKEKKKTMFFVIESCFVFTITEPDGSSGKTVENVLRNDSIHMKVVVICESTTRWQHSYNPG